MAPLHVNDAGKTGLMSKRVALYEQFTVSPQRFAQLSAPCPFFGTTVCDSTSAGSNAMPDTVAMTTKGDNLKHIAAKTADAQLPSNCATLDKAESNDGQAAAVPFDRPMLNDVEVPGPSSAEGHMVIIEDDLEHRKENLPDARCARDNLIGSSSICKIEVETALPSRDTDVSTKPLEGFSSILDTDNRENTCKAARETPCKCGACGESANKNSCHSGVAEASLEDIEMGNSLNDSESLCVLSLSPKAVVQEIGQLRFWKVRLALVRQQRIFSDQVFELHKLIEVQRLLAGTPYTSIDEIYFGVGNINLQCEADALVFNSDLDDKKENAGDAWGKQILVLKQAVEFPTVVGEAKTNSINSRAHLEQSSAVPDVEKGGVSGWGYPSLGVGHWTGSLPAAGSCPYPPLAGGFTPGSAVGGPFAAPVLCLEGAARIRSPMFPFSFPVCLPKRQLTQSVQSNYGSAIAPIHRQHSAPYHNSSSGHKVSNHAGPRTLTKTYGATEGATTSVATISSQPHTSQQKAKAEYPSSLISQMYLHEEGMQPGRKGLAISGSKPEDLQHTVRDSVKLLT